MKKTRLLIALLAMLVAASGYAQDSYRKAVKDFLTVTGQYEKSKSLIPTMSLLFVGNDQVDVGQLTNRYLEERFENDMIDWFMNVAEVRDMTEADLKEVATLLSSPEGKVYEAHQQEWIAELLAEFIESMSMPFMKSAEEMEFDEDKDWSHGGLADLLGQPIQPKADIDAAYAARFKEVILESAFSHEFIDAMMDRFDQDSVFHENQEDRQKAREWMIASVPAALMNSAYGILTLEDLDYAATLYSNEAYCKYTDYGKSADLENLKTGHFFAKYSEWMESQGAKVTEDINVLTEFFKSLFNLANVNVDDLFKFDHLDDE
jgi:hypothetical protein